MASELCSNFIPRLSPFIDGELPVPDRTQIEGHLSSCHDCTARVADLRAESGLIRVGLEMAADEVDFSQFANGVMAKLTPIRPPLLERWRVTFGEMFTYQRAPLMAGAVAALALLLVGIPFLLKGRTPVGYASEQMAVQTVSTEAAAHVAPVVMQAENGDAIIWLVHHDHPDAPDESAEEGVSRDARDSGQELNQERPKGGAL